MKRLIAVFCFGFVAWAGGPDQFRADANVVLINATVLDRHDHPVRGLAREAFRLYEDHAEQRIAYFAEEDTPVSLAVIFDTSGSMLGKLNWMRAALDAVLEDANSADEYALVTFGDRPRVAATWTPDAAEIQNRLLAESPHGETALLDAIAAGVAQIKHAAHPRKALLIFSDGGDNHSRLSERELMHALVETGVQIYAIDSSEPAGLRARSPEEWNGPDLLERICGGAGGRYFQVSGRRDLAAASEQISRELRSQYLIGYVPSNRERDGRFHHVRLQLTRDAAAPNLSLFWRRGYRAPVD